eukprot:TRINITY_DN4312_c0_g1_i1.p1 TRINITY_DN4312_c0_g1~~TRINITY_DN4312_c0_g1_i1.p1  ORF type:complete len:370 (+),score=73.55 TRINITY_DN4312_c0_g1_i1:122-1111(+)
MVAIEDVPPEEELQKGPRLILRIGTPPAKDLTGARNTPFGPGDEVAVVNLEQVKGWEPLRWRFEQNARERSMVGQRKPLWTDGSRCGLQRRYWRAHIFSSDGKGGIEQHVTLLEVFAEKSDRTLEKVQVDIDDAKSAAQHAHRFNAHLARSLGGDVGATAAEGDVPAVKIAVPVGCYVVGGVASSVAAPGDMVSICSFSADEVRKFVFDGREEFHEVPQAFFHYTACQTGGHQFVCDVQGIEEEDGNFLLVDPLVLRTPKAGITDLLGAIVPGKSAANEVPSEAPNAERFDQFHPRCGCLCKAFDPQRRSAQQRKHCGMGVSCGVGGGA